MEKTGCKTICGAPTTLAVWGLMLLLLLLLLLLLMIMMNDLVLFNFLLIAFMPCYYRGYSQLFYVPYLDALALPCFALLE